MSETKRPLRLVIEEDEEMPEIEPLDITPTPNFGTITPTPSTRLDIDCRKVTTPTKTLYGTQGPVVLGCPKENLVYKTTTFKTLQTSLHMSKQDAQYLWDNQKLVHEKVNQIRSEQKAEFKNTPFIATEQIYQDDDTLQIIQQRVTSADGTDAISLNRGFVKSLTDAQVADILLQVFEAIETLYANHLFHNDVHTGNVLVFSDQDNNLRIKVIDYGLMTIYKRLDKGYKLTESSGFPWLDFAQFVQTFDQLVGKSKFKSLEFIQSVLLSTTFVVATDRKSIPIKNVSVSPTFIKSKLNEFIGTPFYESTKFIKSPTSETSDSSDDDGDVEMVFS